MSPPLTAPRIRVITTPLPHRPRSVNAYLIDVGDRNHVLVDGGIDSDDGWRVLGDAIGSMTGRWASVRIQVITHMHLDHVGLVDRVRAASGAPVAMGAIDAERLTNARAHPREEAQYRAEMLRANGAHEDLVKWSDQSTPSNASEFRCDVPVPTDATQLDELPGWTIIWTPGHTAGHVALYREEDGVLVAGDAVLPRISPTIGVNRQREDPVSDYLTTLERIRSLRPSLILPGHREPIQDPLARIDELRKEVLGESQSIADLLTARPESAAAIAARRYAGRDLPPAMRVHAIRETRAHLDHLVRTGGARQGDAQSFRA